MDTFRVGTVVRLKSGGPTMTVSSINTYGDVVEVVTQWFSNYIGYNEPFKGTFRFETLEAVSE